MPGTPRARAKLAAAGVFTDVRSPAALAEMEAIRMNASPGEVIEAISGEVLPRVEGPEPPKHKADGHARLDEFGFDNVLSLIAEGLSQREVGERIGVRVAHLNSWLIDQQQPARTREARKQAAQAWLDRGFAAIDNARDPFALAKAREIAAMCRKYAQVMNPAEYSDRVQVDTTVAESDDAASINAKMKLLMAQIKGE